MRSQYAETKYVADSKLDEAKALATSVEENSLQVELKLRAADAKTAEVSRKSSDVERKLRDIEAQENALRRERSSFNTEYVPLNVMIFLISLHYSFFLGLTVTIFPCVMSGVKLMRVLYLNTEKSCENGKEN